MTATAPVHRTGRRRLLNFIALVHSFHSTEHAATFCNSFKLSQHGLFNKVSHFFN